MTNHPQQHPQRQPSNDSQKNPGVRTDRDPGEIKSRSDDPGQSSYGGFKNEDPSQQHQGDRGRKQDKGQGK
ncbi:hypothetical protein Tamer19_22910 [Cupriavidus sp. TA19]|uniref:hypothetical protein n=1 Tax=unclassified Cupriavidus TaxID=2640874 RepID=UPI000E2FB737|nr:MULTISPECIES: hypothetical protein [unclassified Cupriavidus]BDB28746.1 hypothetical protein CTP10_R61580 [Cupriavidus sp. P-10]GLC92883.1 hypothetical protein Tamer19_22910 [Cupriavidus sp. TA19]